MKNKGVVFALALLLLLASCSPEAEVSVAESSAVSANVLSFVEASSADDSFAENSSVAESSAEESTEVELPPYEGDTLRDLLESITVTPGLGNLPDSPPGSLIPVDRMSKADQSRVGETVEIALIPWSGSPLCYHYVYDSQTGEERLAVVMSEDFMKKSMLIIFRTELGGLDALCAVLERPTAITCEILSITSIMSAEEMYANNAMFSEELDESEQYTQGMELPAVEEGFGYLDTQGMWVFVGDDTPSEEYESILKVYTRMYTRYGLENLFTK